MSNSRPSVLVGFADALAAPEAAASLLASGYRVVSFSRRGRAVALRHMRGVEIVEVTAPEQDFDACVRELADVASAHDVIMPLDDAAVLACDRGLPADALVAGPRGSRALLALDKREQLRAADAAGFEVPSWIELAPEMDPPEDWELPAMLKPALAVEVLDGRLRRVSPTWSRRRASAASCAAHGDPRRLSSSSAGCQDGAPASSVWQTPTAFTI